MLHKLKIEKEDNLQNNPIEMNSFASISTTESSKTIVEACPTDRTKKHGKNMHAARQ